MTAAPPCGVTAAMTVVVLAATHRVIARRDTGRDRDVHRDLVHDLIYAINV